MEVAALCRGPISVVCFPHTVGFPIDGVGDACIIVGRGEEFCEGRHSFGMCVSCGVGFVGLDGYSSY